MKLRRFIAGAATVSIFAGGIAHAGQYDAKDLGQSLPMWMETLASINDEGDVAWTAWDGTSGNQATTAKFYNAANPDHTLNGAASSSWAVGISEQVTDGGNTVVGIAGSTASSQRLTDRSAVLWDVRWSGADGVATSTLIDLGEHTPKLAQGATGTVQQSAAYAVHVPPGSNANTYTVGGFARDKVDKSTYPQPVIWAVSQATSNPVISRQPLTLLHPAAAVGSGYVASIAYNSRTHTTWACGNSTGSHNAYNHATCWDISTGNTSSSPAIINALSSKYGASNVVSSMVHRVRTVPIGPDGALRTVAVGAALVGSGGSHQWKGFVYDLDAGVLYKDLNLSGQNETLAYDVAALTYQGNNNGTPVTSQGMIIAGISSTAPAATLGGLQGGPIGADVTKMTGVNRRMMLSGIEDNGQVCAINDDSQNNLSSSYDQLLAISDEGAHRLAMAGNQLVLLTAMPDAATVEIRNRDATQRRHHYETSRTDVKYYQAQSIFTGRTPAQAIVRVGRALACGPTASEFTDTPACDSTALAAFDIEDGQTLVLNQVGSTGTLRSDITQNALFEVGTNAYAQTAIKDGTDCTITPVQSVDSVVVKDDEPSDFDGKTWTDCSPDKWVDTKIDYDHCGACSTSVESKSNMTGCVNLRCENSDAFAVSYKTDSHEPNNTSMQVTSLGTYDAKDGWKRTIEATLPYHSDIGYEDVDWYHFKINAGGVFGPYARPTIRIEALGDTTDTGIYAIMYLPNAAGGINNCGGAYYHNGNSSLTSSGTYCWNYFPTDFSGTKAFTLRVDFKGTSHSQTDQNVYVQVYRAGSSANSTNGKFKNSCNRYRLRIGDNP